MPKKITCEDFITKCMSVHGDKFDYTKVIYKNTDTEVEIICPQHGSFFQIPKNHVKGQQCPLCAKIERLKGISEKSKLKFIETSNNSHNNKYDYSSAEYTNSNTKILIICPDHGQFLQTPNDHSSGSGCPKCFIDRHKNQFQNNFKSTFEEKARAIHGDKYGYSKVDYVNSFTHVEIICPSHGSFFQIPNDHLNGNNCPKCCRVGFSQGEKEVFEFVKTLSETVTERDRSILGGKELDIYDPIHRIAIEYNGLYWHSSNNRENDKQCSIQHVEKTSKCNDVGVRLFHIQEDEWLKKSEIWKSVLRNAYQKPERRIFARKCMVREITYQEVITFCEHNHLQGGCVARYRFGLFYMDELVSVMTFSETRFSKDYQYEMIRFCNVLNTSVIGGASKLLAHFRSLYSGSIVSYANCRWSVGNVYSQIGFTLSHISEPCYWYIKGIDTQHRDILPTLDYISI